MAGVTEEFGEAATKAKLNLEMAVHIGNPEFRNLPSPKYSVHWTDVVVCSRKSLG